MWTESCPQYLLLSDAELAHWVPLAKIGPPLRPAGGPNQPALWQGLEQGYISCEDMNIRGFSARVLTLDSYTSGARDYARLSPILRVALTPLDRLASSTHHLDRRSLR